ncbi:MAG: Flp pilus assembly protein CpaB [Bdellovibrionales bacterium]|nr:Flp pilus assembly protein CpaB [Bdellovibrionales bacterium]
MNNESVKRYFIDLIEGGLDAVTEARVLEAIEADEQLAKDFNEYKQVVALEQALSGERYEVPAGLTDDVMRAVRKWEPAWQTRLTMIKNNFSKYLLIPGSAVAATAAIALLVSQNQTVTAKQDIKQILEDTRPVTDVGFGAAESGPVVVDPEVAQTAGTDRTTTQPPQSTPGSAVSASIPQGYRAVTIEVDSVSGVEGFAQPGTSVDTVVSYIDPATGQRKAVVASQNAKVLSVGGETAGNGSAYSAQRGKKTVTLAVPVQEALKIDTARKMGAVSLLQRSNSDTSNGASEMLAVNDLAPNSLSATANNRPDGLVRFGDKDGKSKSLELRNGRWTAAQPSPQPPAPAAVSRKSQQRPDRTWALANDGPSAMEAPSKGRTQNAASSGVAGRVAAGDSRSSGVSDRISSIFGSGAMSTAPSPLAASEPVMIAKSNRFEEVGGVIADEQEAEIAPPPSSEYARRYPEIAPYDYVVPNVSGERYGHYDENPRQTPTEAPFSTFGVDVDTASYTNMRRYLSAGTLPPNDAVRIEEFINYFDYDYPSKADRPFTVSYEIAPSPLENERFLLKVGVKARDTAGIDSEKGWNLVFLIDTSGSMAAPNKLPLVKQSLKILAENMRPQDRLAIVTYAGNARILLQSASGDQKAHINAMIDSLRPGGGTNGGAGIDLAYNLAQQNMIRGGVNRVILATDGDFNVGNYHFGQLMNMIEHKRRSGITLTTLGFGTGNINEQNMEQLANRGNGNYFYIDSFKEARRIFDEKLFSTIEVVAKDVKLQVEFNPLQVLEYRLIGYDNRKLEAQDFDNDAKDAGEVGSGHEVTALYELVLTDTPLADRLINQRRYGKSAKKDIEVPEAVADELAYIKVRYKEPEANRSNLLTYKAKRSDVRTDVAKTSDDFRFAAAVSYFGHLLRASRYAGAYNMQQIADLAKGALGSDETGQRREFVELVQNARFARRR